MGKKLLAKLLKKLLVNPLKKLLVKPLKKLLVKPLKKLPAKPLKKLPEKLLKKLPEKMLKKPPLHHGHHREQSGHLRPERLLKKQLCHLHREQHGHLRPERLLKKQLCHLLLKWPTENLFNKQLSEKQLVVGVLQNQRFLSTPGAGSAIHRIV